MFKLSLIGECIPEEKVQVHMQILLIQNKQQYKSKIVK